MGHLRWYNNKRPETSIARAVAATPCDSIRFCWNRFFGRPEMAETAGLPIPAIAKTDIVKNYFL